MLEIINIKPSDVESLFTKGPTLELVNPLFPKEEVSLFKHCLTSSYFHGTINFNRKSKAL